MIDVIKHGNVQHRAVCESCGCVFNYGNEDTTPDGKNVVCPECGHLIPAEGVEHEECERMKTADFYGYTVPLDAHRVMCDIFDCFDFDKVHRCMEALDWKWAGLPEFANEDYGPGGTEDLCMRTPTLDEIKSRAAKILYDAYSEKVTIKSGGFRAAYEYYEDDDEYVLTLSFEIDDTHAGWNYKDRELTCY